MTRISRSRPRRAAPAGVAPSLTLGAAVLAWALALAALTPALAPARPTVAAGVHARGRSASVTAPAKLPATATLEQCAAAATEDGRSATFAGEMAAVPGTARMQISIQLLERLAGEATYHLVAAPGLGAWRSSDPGVDSYKYMRQVVNLAAPASYRAAIRFRWLNARNRVIQALELRTHRCELPAVQVE